MHSLLRKEDKKMAVSNVQYLKGFFDKTKAMGAKAINSDATMEIEGHEASYLLIKQMPWPVLSSAGEIEVPMPLGSMTWQPQQLKTAMQSQVSMSETVSGNIDKMLLELLTTGGVFNAKIYQGTPQKYVRYKRLRDCFLQLDPVDCDWENRTQVLTFSGTLFFNYFGEVVEGQGL